MAAQNNNIIMLKEQVVEIQDADVEDYADFLGVDLEFERDLLPIAREGANMMLPDDWCPCVVEGQEDIFYFNRKTGVSTWEHPLDDIYREKLEEARAQRRFKAVTLRFEEMEGQNQVMALNMAGEVLATVEACKSDQFDAVDDGLRQQLTLDEGLVLRYVTPSGTALGHSSRAKSVEEIFDAAC